MNKIANYEKIWEEKWGDMQTYGPIHRHHRRLLAKMLSEIHFDSLLDVGCGAGQNIHHAMACKELKRVAGIDISEEALKIAKTNLPNEIQLTQLNILEKTLPEKFDLVICFDVIEHIVDDGIFLSSINKMTGKYLIISTLQGRMRDFEKDIGHIRNYKKGELQEKLIRAGFIIDKTIEWGFPLYSPLYRNLLNNNVSQTITTGSFGFLKRILCHILYLLFMLNTARKGDIIVIRAKKPNGELQRDIHG